MKDQVTGAEVEEVLDVDIDELFKDPDASPTSEDDHVVKTPEEKKLELTQAMTKRINEVKSKTEKETLERVAKDLGYESYVAMKKVGEADLIKKQGFNPEDIEKVVEPLVQQRLANDPRLKKLEALEQRERDEYVQSQLAAINTATGQNLTAKDLSKETLELFAKGVGLEQAYYAVNGKEIIAKNKSQINNGTMDHLGTGSSGQGVKTRKLTEEEKDMYRSIAPHLTEDELNKKTVTVPTK